MNYDLPEVVIDKLVSVFRLREWQYDIEEYIEHIAEALKLIGAAKVFIDVEAYVTINNRVGKLPRNCQYVKYVNEPSQYYRETGNFIEIDVPDGTTVKIVYQAVPCDGRGFPLVPDAAEVREALMWYLVKILVLQKEITHVPFNTAEQEWQWRCGSARAELNGLNLQQVNIMYQNFTRLNPIKNAHANNYQILGNENTLDRSRHLNDINRI